MENKQQESPELNPQESPREMPQRKPNEVPDMPGQKKTKSATGRANCKKME